MSEQEGPYKPYDNAFKTLIAARPQLLIPVLNDMFGTTYTDADKVVLMDSKQMKTLPMGKISTREVDSLFAIGGDWRRAYHVELRMPKKLDEEREAGRIDRMIRHGMKARPQAEPRALSWARPQAEPRALSWARPQASSRHTSGSCAMISWSRPSPLLVSTSARVDLGQSAALFPIS